MLLRDSSDIGLRHLTTDHFFQDGPGADGARSLPYAGESLRVLQFISAAILKNHEAL